MLHVQETLLKNFVPSSAKEQLEITTFEVIMAT